MKLLDLFESQYMSLSLKLQIVRSLDCTTRFREGIESFMGISDGETEIDNREPAQSPYQRLVNMMIAKQVLILLYHLYIVYNTTYNFEANYNNH